MSVTDFRLKLLQTLQLALLASKLTKTQSDDKVVEVLLEIALDDNLLGKLFEIVAVANTK